jgi:hypothetical protein
MRARMFVFGFVAALATPVASAHGPQLQITNDNNKIVTREVFVERPYEPLSSAKSAYVMPLEESGGVWYSRPNNTLVADVPAYPSGPGLAFGYDRLDGGDRTFAAGSILSIAFTDGLKLWNGAAFADAGATQLKGFRGSNAAISAPAENFAVTSDGGPFDSLSLAAISATYDAEAHSSLRWALLGDGASPTSASPDGVYLLGLQLSSTQVGLAPSDPYYLVLHKNASPSDVAAAVASLGFAPELVQAVPEPATAAMMLLGLAGGIGAARSRRHRRES